MIVGIGIDIVRLPRIKAVITKSSHSLLQFTRRILTQQEQTEFEQIKNFNKATNYLGIR